MSDNSLDNYINLIAMDVIIDDANSDANAAPEVVPDQNGEASAPLGNPSSEHQRAA